MLERAGTIRTGRVGQAEVRMFSASEALDVIIRALKKQPGLLLCEIEDCEICPRRRKAIGV